MITSHDLQIKTPIGVLARAVGTVSGVIDTLGAQRALVWANKGARSGQSSKVALAVRHASASTTLFASGTAFSTALSSIQTTASATSCMCNAFDIDLAGIKRYLICKMSSVTQSTTAGVQAVLLGNEKVPPTVAAVTAKTGANQQGFLTITRAPAGP